MKTFLPVISLSLLAAFSSVAHARIERVIEKTFAVAPGGTLHVETHGGFIRVEISNESMVKITAQEKIRADSETEADELLKNLTLVMEAQGSAVTASAKYEKPVSSFIWGNQPVQVDFIVTVPARFEADLRTSGGSITVGDLEGRLHARTSGGNVRLGKISGEIDASTSGGNVELAEGKAETKLSTSGGNIILGHIAGPAVVNTSGGDIRAARIENTLSARTSGGNVVVTFVGGFRGDCVLSTSGGKVKATVDPTAGFQLDASTSGGGVKAEGLTITIDKGGAGKSRLSGAVNGGGPALKLRSSGGDIVIARS
jgi:Putative adhesin